MNSAFPSEPAVDPTGSLVRSVRRIAQAVDVRSRGIARLTGLTLPQLLVLQSIRALGEVSTSAISRDVSMSPTTVVDVLDRLEARGMIARYRSTADRRIVHARLTDEGSQAVKTAPGLLGDAVALPVEQRAALAEAMELLSELMATPATSPAISGDRQTPESGSIDGSS